MNVLVTGSAGFLGRHFAARLEADSHDVTGWDIAGGNWPLDALVGFKSDPTPYDLVLHLAAVSPHRAAIDGRALAVGAGNLALDAALFEWAARARPGRVVYFSSSAAYPLYWQDGSTRQRLTEMHMGHWQPDAIYGWVKLTGERLADAYRAQGGTVTVVRPFSGYGEDQAPDFPFGAFRDRAARREDPFTIWGTGEQVRDFVHVDDIVTAVLAAVEQGVDGPLNICTGRGTSMRELAELFCREAGYSPRFELAGDAPAGVAYRVGDPARLHEIYRPRVSIEEGVRRALAHAVVEV